MARIGSSFNSTQRHKAQKTFVVKQNNYKASDFTAKGKIKDNALQVVKQIESELGKDPDKNSRFSRRSLAAVNALVNAAHKKTIDPQEAITLLDSLKATITKSEDDTRDHNQKKTRARSNSDRPNKKVITLHSLSELDQLNIAEDFKKEQSN